MKGIISYIQEKTGKRGPYWTIGLEDGPKGLIVREESIINTLVEGDTYELEVEKDGLYSTVTNATRLNEPGEAKASPSEKPKKPATKPPTGTYHSEYMKKRPLEEQLSIARQAFGKALIEAYARLWIGDTGLFGDLDEFNAEVQNDTDQYIRWLEIEEE